MAVKVNIREGENLRETARGYVHTRTIDVSGLSGTGPEFLFNAMNTSGVPRRGESHPTIPGIKCIERRAAPISKTTARVTCNYGILDEEDDPNESGSGRISISTSTVAETTFRDINGDLMNLTYTGTDLAAGVIQSQQAAQAEFLSTLARFSVTRAQTSRPTRDFILRYTNKVNSSPWSGGAARTWLNLGPHISEINRGLRFSVSWEFIYNPDTWDFLPKFRLNGVVPSDASFGNGGIGRFRVYQEIDFNRIGFSIE